MNIAKRPADKSSSSAVDPGGVRDPARPVLPFTRDSSGGAHIPRHSHRRGQLIYASVGVIAVTTDAGTWIVPPQQAVWVPAGVAHELSSRGPLALRTVYVDPSRAGALPDACCVVAVRPLLRELILVLMDLPPDYAPDGPEARLVAVLLDELQRLRPAALNLPAPVDRRLREIARALLADPADPRTLAQWAAATGAGARTLARLFVRDTGISFGAWRTRLKMLTAIERLALGQSVTEIAYDLGYASPSAFVARFRRTVGLPPAQYLRSGSGEAAPAGMAGENSRRPADVSSAR